MADNASALSIRELGGAKRQLVLVGRALPYRPFKLSGTMRAEFTYYPGNPIGTVQMLGAGEDDTSINGIWKDRFLRSVDDDGNAVDPDGQVKLDERALADVEAIVNAVDDFRMQGQLLEVTWDTRVRQGILKKFSQTWQRHEICEWEMDFGWISRGEDQLPINFAQQGSITGAAMGFMDILNRLLDDISEGIAIWASYNAKVASFVNKLQDSVDAINDTATSVIASTANYADSAHRLISIYETIKEDAAGLKDLVQSLPAAVSWAAPVEEVTYGDSLSAASWNRSVASNAGDMRALAATMGASLQDTLDQQEVMDVFDARQDTDLRDVSTLYFGTPDEWKRLMTYNGLKSSRLTAGMEIMIPKLRSGGSQP